MRDWFNTGESYEGQALPTQGKGCLGQGHPRSSDWPGCSTRLWLQEAKGDMKENKGEGVEIL